MNAERAERWQVIDEIQARNADEDLEETERFVAEEIEAMRAEERARTAATPRA
jgi:hypothetical protein